MEDITCSNLSTVSDYTRLNRIILLFIKFKLFIFEGFILLVQLFQICIAIRQMRHHECSYSIYLERVYFIYLNNNAAISFNCASYSLPCYLQLHKPKDEMGWLGHRMAFAVPDIGPPGHWVRSARHFSLSMKRLFCLHTSSPSLAVRRYNSSCNTVSALSNWFFNSSMDSLISLTSQMSLKSDYE